MDKSILIKALDILGYSEEEKKETYTALNNYLLDGMLDTFLKYLPENKRDEFITKANEGASAEALFQWIESVITESDKKPLQEQIAKHTIEGFEFFFTEVYKKATEDQKQQLDILVKQ